MAIVITASAVVPPTGSTLVRGIAGDTITAGKPIYQDEADGKLKLADTGATDDLADVVGVAVCNSSDGQPISYVKSGRLPGFSGAVVGNFYFLDGDGYALASEVIGDGAWSTLMGCCVVADTFDVHLISTGVQLVDPSP